MSEEEEKVDIPLQAQAILAQMENLKKSSGLTAPTPEETPEVVTCKRCGCVCDEEPLMPTEEERAEYLRCILGGNMYRKDYKLFKGAVQLSFGSLSNDEADAMGAVLGQLNMDQPTLKLQAEAVKIKLMYYLKSLTGRKFEAPKAGALIEDVQKEYRERFGSMSEDYMTILIRAYQEFYQLINLLTNSGFDSGFWEGAGLS